MPVSDNYVQRVRTCDSLYPSDGVPPIPARQTERKVDADGPVSVAVADEIPAVPTENPIVAWPPVQIVVSGGTGEPIISTHSADGVRLSAPTKYILPGSTKNDVVPTCPSNPVPPGTPIQAIP